MHPTGLAVALFGPVLDHMVHRRQNDQRQYGGDGEAADYHGRNAALHIAATPVWSAAGNIPKVATVAVISTAASARSPLS